MNFTFGFFLESALFGVGLAMDAFSVSLANGLNEQHMKLRRQGLIAGTFCFFQFIMPLIGWLFVHTIVTLFSSFEKLIPWIALVLLLYIGGKMLIEGIRNKGGGEAAAVSFGALMLQGIATSIDALSVGFTIAEYSFLEAFVSSAVIAVVTFIISFAGLYLGRKLGTKLSGKASILGGVILIAIGIEIFVTGLF